MKIVFITDDGYQFDNKMDALKWENETSKVHQRLIKILMTNDGMPVEKVAHAILQDEDLTITLIPF